MGFAHALPMREFVWRAMRSPLWLNEMGEVVMKILLFIDTIYTITSTITSSKLRQSSLSIIRIMFAYFNDLKKKKDPKRSF